MKTNKTDMKTNKSDISPCRFLDKAQIFLTFAPRNHYDFPGYL